MRALPKPLHEEEPDPIEIPGEAFETATENIPRSLAICAGIGLIIGIGLSVAGCYLFG